MVGKDGTTGYHDVSTNKTTDILVPVTKMMDTFNRLRSCMKVERIATKSKQMI